MGQKGLKTVQFGLAYKGVIDGSEIYNVEISRVFDIWKSLIEQLNKEKEVQKQAAEKVAAQIKSARRRASRK